MRVLTCPEPVGLRSLRDVLPAVQRSLVTEGLEVLHDLAHVLSREQQGEEEEGDDGDYLDWHDDERGGAEEDEAAGRGQAGRHDPEPVSRQLPVVDM